jgi:hypothetical protein
VKREKDEPITVSGHPCHSCYERFLRPEIQSLVMARRAKAVELLDASNPITPLNVMEKGYRLESDSDRNAMLREMRISRWLLTGILLAFVVMLLGGLVIVLLLWPLAEPMGSAMQHGASITRQVDEILQKPEFRQLLSALATAASYLPTLKDALPEDASEQISDIIRHTKSALSLVGRAEDVFNSYQDIDAHSMITFVRDQRLLEYTARLAAVAIQTLEAFESENSIVDALGDLKSVLRTLRDRIDNLTQNGLVLKL